MTVGTRGRWLIGAGAAFAALVAAGLLAFGAAVSALKGKVAVALGPTSEIGALRVGWSGLSVEGLRIPAPGDWPAKDALRAERVEIVPNLRSLVFGGAVRVYSITAIAPYLSVRRGRDGKLVALPGLFRKTDSDTATPSKALDVSIGEIALEDGVLELFDASVSTPALAIRLEQIEASLRDLSVPALRGRSSFELDAVVKGVARDGRARIAGWAELGTRESSITMELRGVDLAPFQPYLLRAGEAGIRSGRFDLDLQSEVRDARLNAPGRITLVGLELAPADGPFDTFLGVSRSAVLTAMKENGDKLTLDFTLAGDIDDPEFSLNEALGTQIAYSLAETLGVSLGGLVKGVGTLGLKGGEALGEAAKGAGGALLDLLEQEKK